MSPQSDVQDPVAARIARILDAKRRGNAEILSSLKVAEESWERLNKEVDTAIGHEFDLVASERDAVQAARDRLEDPGKEPSDDGFVVTGRVFDNTSKVGLPQILVRVMADRDVAGEPLAEAVTDAAGAYRAVVRAELFDPAGDQTAVRVEAMQPADGRIVARARLALVMRVGGVEQVDLPVKATRGVSDQVVAGEAARDSVEETLASVELRLASMRAAHTATTRFSDLTRDGLKDLSAAMAADPPPIESSVPIPGIDPVAPPDRPTPPDPDEPQPDPPVTSTSLEEIPGIGPRIAKKLRDAGIPDVETLVRFPPEKLAEILGEELAKKAIQAGEELLHGRDG